MKRTLVSLLTLLTLSGLSVFTSCQKDTPGDGSQFRATMEPTADGKTVLSGTALNWVSGDQVAIYGTAGRGLYAATPQTPATVATLDNVSGETGDGPFRAFYPASLTTDGATITLPAAQTYVEGSINEFPMYAESATNQLAFKNLCGVLKLHLTKANTNITSITVKANAEICGNFTVSYVNDAPQLSYVQGGSNTVTMTCATPQDISNGKDFYIALPATFDSLKSIELNTADGRYCVKTVKSNVCINVQRSAVTEIEFGESDMNFVEPLPQGALPGLFSVSATQQVRFSQGNLQYQASTDTWRFATKQYDYVGNATYGNVYENGEKCNNNLISDTYAGWIDLMAWGTGANPTFSGSNSTFVDWGINAISNGGDQSNAWRTLSSNEWNYMFTQRTGATAKYGIICINGVYGLMILPDEWEMPENLSFAPGTSSTSWRNNNFTLSEWMMLQDNGAVFLPAAGVRESYSSCRGVGPMNDACLTYWSSTPTQVAVLGCYYGYFAVLHYDGNRYCGRSIRLVMNDD